MLLSALGRCEPNTPSLGGSSARVLDVSSDLSILLVSADPDEEPGWQFFQFILRAGRESLDADRIPTFLNTDRRTFKYRVQNANCTVFFLGCGLVKRDEGQIWADVEVSPTVGLRDETY